MNPAHNTSVIPFQNLRDKRMMVTWPRVPARTELGQFAIPLINMRNTFIMLHNDLHKN